MLSDLDSKLNAELGALQLTPTPDIAEANDKGRMAEEPGYPCPRCKEGIVRRLHGREFYGCSRYKEGCTYKVSTRIAGKTLTDTQASTLIAKGKVGPMKGFMSKAGKPFEASLVCTEETDWKAIFEFSKAK